MKWIFAIILLQPWIVLAETISQPLPEAAPAKLWKAKGFFEYPQYKFLLSTGEGRGNLAAHRQRLQFNPANHPEIGFALSRDIFFIRYKTALKNMSNFTYGGYELGKTDVTNLEVGAVFGFFKVDVFYRRFKGFFVDLNATSGFTVEDSNGNTTIVDGGSNNKSPEILVRPDIESYNYGFSGEGVMPVLGPDSFLSSFGDFSDLARIWQFDFTLGGGYNRVAIQGNQSFVPADRQNLFPNIATLNGIFQHRLGAQFGWKNRFYLAEKFHLMMDVAGGGDVFVQTSRLAQGEQRDFSTGKFIQFLFGFRYDNQKHQWGLGYLTEYRISDLSAAQVDSNYSRLGAEYSIVF